MFELFIKINFSKYVLCTCVHVFWSIYGPFKILKSSKFYFRVGYYISCWYINYIVSSTNDFKRCIVKMMSRPHESYIFLLIRLTVRVYVNCVYILYNYI